MIGDLGDHRNVGGRAAQDRLVDALHIGADEGDQRLDAGLVRSIFQGNDNAQNRLLRGSPPAY